MGGKNVEKELKYGLSASAHRKLRALLDDTPGARVVDQLNVYFDDERLSLRRARFGLRVRIVDGKKAIVAAKFGGKSPAGGPAGYKVRSEIESPLALPLARALAAGKKPIGKLGNAPLRQVRDRFAPEVVAALRPIASLRTERAVVPFAEWDLEIDRCEVLGRVFYELEVETSTPARADRAVRELLATFGLTARPLRRSKLARVFSTLAAQKKTLEKGAASLSRRGTQPR